MSDDEGRRGEKWAREEERERKRGGGKEEEREKRENKKLRGQETEHKTM